MNRRGFIGTLALTCAAPLSSAKYGVFARHPVETERVTRARLGLLRKD